MDTLGHLGQHPSSEQHQSKPSLQPYMRYNSCSKPKVISQEKQQGPLNSKNRLVVWAMSNLNDFEKVTRTWEREVKKSLLEPEHEDANPLFSKSETVKLGITHSSAEANKDKCDSKLVSAPRRSLLNHSLPRPEHSLCKDHNSNRRIRGIPRRKTYDRVVGI